DGFRVVDWTTTETSVGLRDGPQSLRPCGIAACEAEGEGFEPSSDETARNGFRDRRIRPLCHPSAVQQGYLGVAPLSGEGGIRTLEAGISPPNALAGRRLQPLGHFSGRAQDTRGFSRALARSGLRA